MHLSRLRRFATNNPGLVLLSPDALSDLRSGERWWACGV